MTKDQISKLLNAVGTLKADATHLTHILNCGTCRTVVGGVEDLVQAYVLLVGKHKALESQINRLKKKKGKSGGNGPVSH